MKCQHGKPFHVECLACELRDSQAEVAGLRRQLGDAETRLALLAVRLNRSALAGSGINGVLR